MFDSPPRFGGGTRPDRARRPTKTGVAPTIGPVANRYRCSACGNLTRFDVVVQRRAREFHHFSVAGELTIEDEEKLAETIERVTCRWCAATGDSIEEIPAAIEPSIEAPSA
ncbi:MAG: hypothetical protein QOH10_1082 [Actinomycetota bacterium]|nr:hypothetical protein [Actinomycetota bacterium]